MPLPPPAGTVHWFSENTKALFTFYRQSHRFLTVEFFIFVLTLYVNSTQPHRIVFDQLQIVRKTVTLKVSVNKA